MEIIDPEPVPYESDVARPSGGTVHIANQGDMEAVIVEIKHGVRLLDEEGEEFDIPDSVKVNLASPKKLNSGGRFASGSTEALDLSVKISGFADLPPSFVVESTVQLELRDNTQTYSIGDFGRLHVENLRYDHTEQGLSKADSTR